MCSPACLPVSLPNGSAGDLAATALGMDAMHAGDLIEYLPQAWKMLREN